MSATGSLKTKRQWAKPEEKNIMNMKAPYVQLKDLIIQTKRLDDYCDQILNVDTSQARISLPETFSF